MLNQNDNIEIWRVRLEKLSIFTEKIYLESLISMIYFFDRTTIRLLLFFIAINHLPLLAKFIFQWSKNI